MSASFDLSCAVRKHVSGRLCLVFSGLCQSHVPLMMLVGREPKGYPLGTADADAFAGVQQLQSLCMIRAVCAFRIRQCSSQHPWWCILLCRYHVGFVKRRRYGDLSQLSWNKVK